MRTLLVGAGTVGRKHLAALEDSECCALVGLVETAPGAGLDTAVPLWSDLPEALAALRPDFVIVAVPPPASLPLARQAASTGAAVLVEKPVTLTPADLASRPGDERIYVAFQPHFAPGIAGLLDSAPVFDRAEVELVCRRDAAYFRGWRRRRHQAGGILHQQAIHGLALALRLLPTTAAVATAAACTWHHRYYSPAEDAFTGTVAFTSGHRLVVAARTDAADDDHRRHELRLIGAEGQAVVVTGRNLQAGTGPQYTAPSDSALRQALYRAVATHTAGGLRHPGLYGVGELARTLEVINHVYRRAESVCW